jgi:uncharacterized protein
MPLTQYFRDYLFLIPLVVLVLTEIAKSLVEGVKTGNWHEPVFRAGGMPSSHSAFVTSLLIVLWHKVGPTSTEFAIAFVFACVVWYDAMSSRRAIGEQAAILNRLQHWQKLTERLGHSGKQVVMGILFGAVVTKVGILLSERM